MFNFNVVFLQDIRSCEMKKSDRPVWFIKDMSVRPMVFSKRISSVSVRSTLNLNHSNLTYLVLAGLTNTVVKGKTIFLQSLVVQKISMRFYHTVFYIDLAYTSYYMLNNKKNPSK